MHSMTQQDRIVTGGVDAHADTHHVAALDERGALLSTKSFPTTTPGYRQLLDWLSRFGAVEVVAVESTGSYAAGLVRYLREHEIRVLEVNQPHAHTRRRRGKSDPIDAEMAARLALAGKGEYRAEADRRDRRVDPAAQGARNSAVKSRSVALVQLDGLIVTAPQEAPRPARRAQDAARQGLALPPAQTIERRSALPFPSSEVRPALSRPADRLPRPRGHRA